MSPGVRPPSPALAQAAAAPAPYDVVVLSNVMVPMRDGVRLATDVYLPARDGKPVEGGRPVILERTPYSKDGVADGWPRHFVPRGYVAVVQDVRGRFRSEGRWRPLRDDGPDGFDLAEWIGRQPWSNGRIGTVGTSYAGGTQHAMAIANAPHLAAMVPVDAMSNGGRYGIRHNGAFELRWLNWVLTLGNATGARAGAAGVAAGAGPNARAAALRAASTPLAAPLSRTWACACASSRRRCRCARARRRCASPPTTRRGWSRPCATGTPTPTGRTWDRAWSTTSRSTRTCPSTTSPAGTTRGAHRWRTSTTSSSAGRSEPPSASSSGRGRTGGSRLTFSGEAEFGPDARVDMNVFRERWFDRWLKGVDNGVERGTPVRLFVMGGGDRHRTPEGRVFVGGRWRDEREWPLARAASPPTTSMPTADSRRTCRTPPRRRPTASTRGARCPRSAATSRPRAT